MHQRTVELVELGVQLGVDRGPQELGIRVEEAVRNQMLAA